MKNKLPAVLLATGLFILIFSLIKVAQQLSNGLKEYSPLPADYPYRSDWRHRMDENAAQYWGNGRIPILTRLS